MKEILTLLELNLTSKEIQQDIEKALFSMSNNDLGLYDLDIYLKSLVKDLKLKTCVYRKLKKHLSTLQSQPILDPTFSPFAFDDTPADNQLEDLGIEQEIAAISSAKKSWNTKTKAWEIYQAFSKGITWAEILSELAKKGVTSSYAINTLEKYKQGVKKEGGVFIVVQNQETGHLSLRKLTFEDYDNLVLKGAIPVKGVSLRKHW